MKNWLAILAFCLSVIQVPGQYFNGSEQWHSRIQGEILTDHLV